MYSEENERLAEAAFTRYRAAHDPSLPEWASYFPKHLWRDLVQTFEANPRSHIAIANPMEQCVSDVLREKEVGCVPAMITVEQFNEAKRVIEEGAHPVDIIAPKHKPAKATKK